MRISRSLILCCVAIGTGLVAPDAVRSQQNEVQAGARSANANPLSVLPAPLPGSAAAVPLAPFASVKDALKAGVRDYNAGEKVRAIKALEFAAGQGHLTAQWKLGRMYADGDGVPHDDLKAFEYFSKIADENADETPGTADGKIVATAFVALGQYFRTGIKGSYVKVNAGRSFDMFHYAATYFRDPDAQFGLGQLHLEGVGTARDAKQAARWLKLAADKGHAQSQALLGDILVRGEGIQRQVAEGLMWLSVAKEASAREGAASGEVKWIADLHARAYAQAGQSDRDAAAAYLVKRRIERR